VIERGDDIVMLIESPPHSIDFFLEAAVPAG
jgi:hypothetical protein